jgi:hypothetical protein
MQAFQRPNTPQMPQAPPPPPNKEIVEQSRQAGKLAAREAHGRASTILTKPPKDDDTSLGVLNKKAPSLS